MYCANNSDFLSDYLIFTLHNFSLKDADMLVNFFFMQNSFCFSKRILRIDRRSGVQSYDTERDQHGFCFCLLQQHAAPLDPHYLSTHRISL